MLLAMSKTDDQIAVIINEERAYFGFKELTQLYFFKKLTKHTQQVKLECQKFTCEHIAMLLSYGKLKHIPFDIEDYNIIDSLLYASDYLTSSEDKYYHINENAIMQYLINKTPALGMGTLKDWLINAQHVILRKSLLKLHDLFTQQINEYTQAIFSKTMAKQNFYITSKVTGLEAVVLFAKIFKIDTDYAESGKLASLFINCYIFEDFVKLWNQFDFTKHWNIICPLVSDAISACLQVDLFDWGGIDMNSSDCRAIVFLLENIIKDMDCLDNTESIPAIISRFNLVVAAFKCVHIWYYTYNSLDDWILKTLQMNLLKVTETQKFLDHILSVKNRYITHKKVDIHWCKIFLYILEHCNQIFLIENVKQWFPALYETLVCRCKMLDINKWLFDKIFSGLNTKLSFDFTMYLIHYIIFDKPSETESFCPELMLQIKTITGTDWTNVDHVKRVT